MADPVTGAVIGLAFAEFWKAVKKARNRAKDFEPKLRDLEKILEQLRPVVLAIERKKTKPNESDQREMDDLYSTMQDGNKLVSKCIGIKWWNMIKKSYYQKKLVDLDNKIQRFINRGLQLLMFWQLESLTQRSEKGAQCAPVTRAAAPALPSTDSKLICGDLVDFSGLLNLRSPRPLAPPQVSRLPTIRIFGLIVLLFLPSEAEILKGIATIIILYQGIMSMLEKSENEICMVIKDVGMLKTTAEQLDATMRSLANVLEEIQNDHKQLLKNEPDLITASESLRRLTEEGQEMACESSYDIVWWNVVRKWQYQKRMAELDHELLRIQSLYLQARLGKNIEVEKEATKFPLLAQLQNIHKKINKVDLQMPCGIVGRAISYNFGIDNKDIREFLSLQEIDIGWITFAIIYFHKMCVERKLNTSYGFLCPGNLSKRNNNRLEDRMRYVGYTLGQTQLSCYLAPIVEGYHWSLCVACPLINVIFWFDSLGHKPDGDIKTIFNIALKTYYIMGGKREGKSGHTKWFQPKCPRQSGKTECGYYVLLYMYNIIFSGLTTNFEQIFRNQDAYTIDDINLIRNLLSGCLLQHIDNDV